MIEDEIVAEVRRIRDDYAKSLGYDLDAIFKDLKEKERMSGRPRVMRPPKRPVIHPSSSRETEN